MSNLTDAKKALEAEIAHVEQGAAYYAGRVTALEMALAGLRKLDSTVPTTDTMHTASPQAVKSKRQERAGKKAVSTSGDALPKTGSDFWKELVTATGISGVELQAAAFAKLSPNLSRDQKNKIKQRMHPALASLIKVKKIHSEGIGRDRRFFK